MTWYCAKTFGPDVRAVFNLERAGLTVFSPVIHRYAKDRRTGREKRRVVRLFPGYAFVMLHGPVERDKCVSASGVAYMLGSWSGDTFAPREMPTEWVEALRRAGPKVEGKRVPFQKGQRVTLARHHLSGLIATVEQDMRKNLDASGKIKVRVELFGASRVAEVYADELEPVAD